MANTIEATDNWTIELDKNFDALRNKVFMRLAGLSFHTLNQAKCRQLYVSYLLESYAYVRHTSRILALAASRMEEVHQPIRSFLFRHAVAEDKHHHMILRDLKWLDVSTENAQRYEPSIICQALVGYVYKVSAQDNPVGILGDAYFLENMSLSSADGFANQILERCDLPEKAVSFMRNHGKLDVEHVKSLQRVFSYVKRSEDCESILKTMHVVGGLYADMMSGLSAVATTRNQQPELVEELVGA